MSDRNWTAERPLRDAEYKRMAEERMSNEKIQLTLHLHKATPKAVLVSDDGDEETAVWLPLSQIDIDESAEEDEVTEIGVPEWLAKDKGLL